jgi:hypothetical protein
LLLVDFENLSGLKINYSKSEVISLNLIEQEGNTLSTRLGCKVWTLPIKYLGVPLHWKKLRNNDCDFLIQKIEKKLQNWKENYFQ